MRWDLFCRVIDNHGDLGVCWRLASQLAGIGHAVCLYVDDARALLWMAPQGAIGVTVRGWQDATHVAVPGDVVIEAFGCELPEAFVKAMRRMASPPVWINLEYLSAEDFVERSHGLPSPQAGAAAGLMKWFFYPGFTDKTGGLLRSVAPPAQTSARIPLPARRPEERMVSIFAYEHARIEPLLHALDVAPTLILALQGPSLSLVQQAFQNAEHFHHLRYEPLPWVSQPGFDTVLDACDLNVVRGEDSLVRALWSGHPFLWNIYAQDDGAHAAKLHALLDRMLVHAPATIAGTLRQHALALNGLGPACQAPIDDGLLCAWKGAIDPWLQALRAQRSLVSRLLDFAEARRHPEHG
jgi:uncharacterized repeat protein (TIGR03837 family)